ncbi:esterase FE4-like [Phymastichus coffea]|uniref:esterase FE4-like n=1 Tax=Phymastichus coffea TaxID=108790 RepID=UPI00273C3465|nr:esterase FE4-like [Phymastichus coffea]
MQNPVVEIQDGQIRGVIKKTVDGREYCAFLGVPYAKPPIGDLRFKDPEPIDSWTGIKDTTKYGNPCAQIDASGNFIGSEDCLFINVCVRSLENVDKPKPVMVWFHVGGFVYGSGCDLMYGPDYFLRKDIVFVSFNYRLGLLGFLNLEHEVAPGNQGIKDQLLALKWVQTNIRKFGGDPNNVTAFGGSAGAVSIQILALSPMGKGLFHRAINQSGSIHNTWVTIKEPKKYAFRLCTHFGKYQQDPEKMVTFLRTLNIRPMLQTAEKVKKTIECLYAVYPFTLGVDDKSPNPVLPIRPEELLLQGIQMPFLFGHNNNEGLYFLLNLHDFTGLKSSDFDRYNKNIDKAINEKASDVLKDYNLTKQDLKNMYFKDEKISISNCDKFANMLGDLNIIQGIHKFARIQVEKNPYPNYFYIFSYDDEISSTKLVLPKLLKGCCHADEIEYLFHGTFRTKRGCNPHQKGTVSYKVMERMIELWTNFAIYGTPTPSTSDILPIMWEPLDDANNLQYMDIGRELQMKRMLSVDQRFLLAKSKEL